MFFFPVLRLIFNVAGYSAVVMKLIFTCRQIAPGRQQKDHGPMRAQVKQREWVVTKTPRETCMLFMIFSLPTVINAMAGRRITELNSPMAHTLTILLSIG
ncbi:hypothetical protein BV898_04088 [Hypsibius exemplaris]|uniref:Uncharacterized protein n=1 Tax=Hypsibius exemplaris TaxID=2072580 RepID=A0A1W0X3I4_HYPEX|nr:hypothetical protein BV898_04088 [Hypsibius exemplaris]